MQQSGERKICIPVGLNNCRRVSTSIHPHLLSCYELNLNGNVAFIHCGYVTLLKIMFSLEEACLSYRSTVQLIELLYFLLCQLYYLFFMNIRLFMNVDNIDSLSVDK